METPSPSRPSEAPSRPSEAPSRPLRHPTSERHTLPPRPPRLATGEAPRAPQAALPEPSPSSARAPRPSREELSLKLTPAQHFDQGLKLLKNNLKERARAAFLLALEGEPQNSRYRAYAAWINYLHDPERAFAHSFKVLNELVDEQRDDPRPMVEARLFLACILERQGDDEKAARAFRAVLKADANNVEAQRFLRLHEMRKKEGSGQESFFGKLFQKKK
jgi:tetratricopeptide (TPR) repeat protein